MRGNVALTSRKMSIAIGLMTCCALTIAIDASADSRQKPIVVAAKTDRLFLATAVHPGEVVVCITHGRRLRDRVPLARSAAVETLTGDTAKDGSHLLLAIVRFPDGHTRIACA
jgi:hypothetical protein